MDQKQATGVIKPDEGKHRYEGIRYGQQQGFHVGLCLWVEEQGKYSSSTTSGVRINMLFVARLNYGGTFTVYMGNLSSAHWHTVVTYGEKLRSKDTAEKLFPALIEASWRFIR